MTLEYYRRKKRNILIIKPEGWLDTRSSPSLEKYMNERYDEARQLILDFQKVEFISSAGLRVVMQAYKHMKDKGGLLVRNVCPQVMNVFSLTGYNHVLKIEE